jgi:hypothetical protein
MVTKVTIPINRVHREFVRLLFLQAHRETDRFFAASGVQSAQSTSGQFHFRHAAFSQHLKRKVGLTLAILETGKSSHPLGRLYTKTFYFFDFEKI